MPRYCSPVRTPAASRARSSVPKNSCRRDRSQGCESAQSTAAAAISLLLRLALWRVEPVDDLTEILGLYRLVLGCVGVVQRTEHSALDVHVEHPLCALDRLPRQLHDLLRARDCL